MRIYEGSPRQDYEEVLRSIGAFFDEHGLRDILLTEVQDGFIVQALLGSDGEGRGWSQPASRLEKETLTFLDDDISRFMQEARARRGGGRGEPNARIAGFYEKALRVIGRYIDQQKPRDVFFFEMGGDFVLRLLVQTGTGPKHTVVEFTRVELDAMIQEGRMRRGATGASDGMSGVLAHTAARELDEHRLWEPLNQSSKQIGGRR